MSCAWRVKAGMVREWVAGKTVWSPCYHGPYLSTLAMGSSDNRFYTITLLYHIVFGHSNEAFYGTFPGMPGRAGFIQPLTSKELIKEIYLVPWSQFIMWHEGWHTVSPIRLILLIYTKDELSLQIYRCNTKYESATNRRRWHSWATLLSRERRSVPDFFASTQ